TPVVGQATGPRTLFVHADDVVRIVGQTFQGVRVDGFDRSVDTRAARVQVARTRHVGDVGVGDARIHEGGIVGLDAEAAPDARQEVEEALIRQFEALDRGAVAVDRTVDADRLRHAIVRA